MPCAIVIPARRASSRFVNKPLRRLGSMSMLAHVCQIARCADPGATLIVATDDDAIALHAQSLGVEVARPEGQFNNGSERVLAAIQEYEARLNPRGTQVVFDTIINLQGDAPLTPPTAIRAAALALMAADLDIGMATPIVALNATQAQALAQHKQEGLSSGTLVAFDRRYRALYFSKTMIPNVRQAASDGVAAWRHIGTYAFRRAALEQFCALAPSRLEEVEQLEQLRALEHGMPILVVPVEMGQRTLWSVDYPQDADVVEAIMRREGPVC